MNKTVRIGCQAMFFLILTVFMSSFALSDSSGWFTFGNSGNFSLNYQSGRNRDVLGQLNNVSHGMSRQPLVVDLDGDGDKEIPIMYNNKLDIYSASNLTLLDSYNTGMWYWSSSGSDIVLDVHDWDLDGYKEILVIVGDSGDQTQGYFQEYQWTGTALTLENSFKISDAISGVNQMKCQIDFNRDGNVDCMMLARSASNASLVTMVGIDKDTTSVNNLAINISVSPSNPAISTDYKPLQFIDADRDGYLEVLYFDTNIYVFNETGHHATISVSTFRSGLNIQTYVTDAVWYQADVGDYEIASVGWVNKYTGGGQDHYRTALHVHDMDGNELAETSSADDCPYTTTGLGGGIMDGESSLSLAGVQGQNLFVWSYIYIQNYPDVYTICKYDNSLNRIYQHTLDTYSSDNYYGIQFTQADMYGGAEDELISTRGVYSVTSGAKIYDVTGGQGWCVPVDVDGDSLLELVCTEQDTITAIYDESAEGGGAYNYRPELLYSTVSDQYPNQGETVQVRIYADDPEGDRIYYAGDCQYDNESDEDVAMNAFSDGVMYGYTEDDFDFLTCTYTENGTYTLKTWVTDDEHGGFSDILSDMDSYTKTIYVGGINIPCFEPFFFCENFDYTAPLVTNGWYVYRASDSTFRTDVYPLDNKLKFATSEGYEMYHFIDEHTYPIISARFNLTVNNTDVNSFNFKVNRYWTDEYGGEHLDNQVYLRWVGGNIRAYTGWEYRESSLSIGTYSAGTEYQYVINIYYKGTSFAFNESRKQPNTYDVFQNGALVKSGLLFRHQETGEFFDDINVTEDTEFYSNQIQIGSYYVNITMDDLYLYKGTDPDYDNTDDLTVLPEIPAEEYWEIPEYWGCWIVKGGSGYDCTYDKYSCQDCCGYVDGELQVTKIGCTFGKIILMFARNFRNWFFKNIWYFAIFGGLIVVVVLLFRKIKSGVM